MFKTRSTISASIVAAFGMMACTVQSGSKPAEDIDGQTFGGGGADTDSESSTGTGGRSSTFISASGGKLGGAGGSSVSCVLGGAITADTTWEPNAACPQGYEVDESVIVSGTGTSLTIKPGTTLKFASGTILEIQAGASLVAAGTAENPITFTGWQKAPGAWGGIVFRSSALENEISHAIVEYGGEKDTASASVVLSFDVQYARLKLANTVIRESGQFGMSVYQDTTLAQFENNTITKNVAGAIRVRVPSVHQLRGSGNTILDNGESNSIFIDARRATPLQADVTWPNLAPAIYRVGSLESGIDPQIYVEKHLTLEAGTVMEFGAGAGFFVRGVTAGLSAIGTAEKPITFRGVQGTGWTGITIAESAWTGNAFEEVHVENASGPLYDSAIFFNKLTFAAIGLTQIYSDKPALLRVKNLTVSGPNNAPTDIIYWKPSAVVVEGVNKGSAADGGLVVYP